MDNTAHTRKRTILFPDTITNFQFDSIQEELEKLNGNIKDEIISNKDLKHKKEGKRCLFSFFYEKGIFWSTRS